HTAFAETRNATLLGTDHNGGTNSIISLRSTGDGTARMLPSPYRRSPVINMHFITFGARSITFASLCSGQFKSALIYSDDDGDSWNRLIENDHRYIQIHIANAQQRVSSSLVLWFDNWVTGEKRTFIISAVA